MLAARTSSRLSERLFQGQKVKKGGAGHVTPPLVSERSPAHTYISTPHTDEHNTLIESKNDPTSWACEGVVMGFVQ